MTTSGGKTALPQHEITASASHKAGAIFSMEDEKKALDKGSGRISINDAETSGIMSSQENRDILSIVTPILVYRAEKMAKVAVSQTGSESKDSQSEGS